MTHYVPISQVLDVLAPLLAVHHYVVLVGCGGAGGADCGAVHAASRMVAPTLLARTSFRTSFGQTILWGKFGWMLLAALAARYWSGHASTEVWRAGKIIRRAGPQPRPRYAAVSVRDLRTDLKPF
jgi:hypothetical protein